MAHSFPTTTHSWKRGIIDSTSVLELVHLLEQQYQIKIEDEDLTPENLDSIRNLARFIETKRPRPS